MSAHKIDADLPTEVIAAVAETCGFRVHYDRSPGTDEWTLSRGHGSTHVQHVGTRRDVCAFLTGYANMQIQTTKILSELEKAHRALILDVRQRLGQTENSDVAH